MTALPRPTAWLVVSAAVAATLLATVHAVETFGGYPPCELCLRQREVLWTVLGVAAAGLGLARLNPMWARIALVATAVGFAVGAAVAGYHAGVEWRWWPGPAACTGAHAGPVSAADVRAVLSGAKTVHMVRCDQAAFRVAGLSLAGWNALVSAALAVASLLVLARKERP